MDKLEHGLISFVLTVALSIVLQTPLVAAMCVLSAGIGWEAAQWEVKVNWAGWKDTLLDLGFDLVGVFVGYSVYMFFRP